MSRLARAWIPFAVASLLIIGIPGAVVVGVLWYQRSGVIETTLQPQAVRLGADPRTISVGVVWLEDGWCLGEFRARVTEMSSEVQVAMIHRQFTHGGNCAGVGTVYNTAWADVSLDAPIATRRVVRSGDDAELPILTQDEHFLRRHPVAGDISQFGGLNDNPPMALKMEMHITDAATLENLARQLGSLPPYPLGTFNCPFDDASYYVVDLNYATGGDTSLKINARGCAGVYVNGLKKPTAWAKPGQVDIFQLLDSLLHG